MREDQLSEYVRRIDPDWDAKSIAQQKKRRDRERALDEISAISQKYQIGGETHEELQAIISKIREQAHAIDSGDQ